MELALDSATPWAASRRSANAASENTFLTPVWQSSKLPRTAHTCTFSPVCVTICLRWMSLTPPSGNSTPMRTPSASLNPSNAALPVSPEVATRMRKSWSSCPRSRSAPALAEKNRGRHCRAMSLNALVGPCHSSSTWVCASSDVRGQMRSSSKFFP